MEHPERCTSSPCPNRAGPLLLYALLLLAGARAHAATYCVASVAELDDALFAAAESIDYDEIRLVRGTYASPSTFSYASYNSGGLFLGGGWEPGCAARSYDASATVLDGGGTHQVLRLAYLQTGSVPFAPRLTVENLTVRNGVASGFVRGGGISLASFALAPAQAELWLENVVVRNCSGYFAGGADLYAARGMLRVSNSLFVDNDAPTSAFGHLAMTVNATEAGNGQGAIVVNSTFVNGTCAAQGGRGCGIFLGLPTGLRGDVLNSVFANNAIADVTIEALATSGGAAFIDSSLVPAVNGNIAPTVTLPIAGAPGFVDAAAGNFRPRNDSPLIDRGLGVPAYYGYNFFDLDGAYRVRNGVPDAGAYENQVIVFADGFE